MITDKEEEVIPSFKSGFKEITSPLHRVVPAYKVYAPVPDLTNEELQEEWCMHALTGAEQ